MGDPVTMAVVGASAGAMMNKKDPLKGALLGAAGGYGGASMMGLGATTAGTTAIGSGATAAGTTAGTATGSAITAGAGGSAAGNLAAVPSYGAAPFQVGATGVPSAGVFSNPAAYTPSTNVAVERTFGPIESLLNPNIQSSSLNSADRLATGERFKLGDIGQFAQQNPVLTQMAYGTARDLLRNDQPQLQSPGLMRGTQMQVAAPQYQVGVPKVSLI